MNPSPASAERSTADVAFSLHTATIMHTNVATDARVARAAGYDGVELWFPKVARYLDAGYSTDELLAELGPLRVTMIDTLLPIESRDPATRERLLSECARMSALAARAGCAAIQVVALDEFDGSDWPTQRRALVSSLAELADVAHPHGVRLAIEPVVFSPFHSLPRALELIDEVGRDRVGLCLDTWHLWTTDTPWDDVARLDRDLVVAAHISDTQPRSGASWRDTDRSALPGEGILPLREAIQAIAATGYDGAWSVEMKSERHWEWDPEVLATAVLEHARQAMSASRA
jgi:sugar phosphate isomerase/epimerase